MELFDFNSLFEDRNRCFLYGLNEEPNMNFGWIGGNAPVFFEDKISIVNDGIEYYFYLTLINPLNKNKSISIFVPKDENIYMDNDVYPNCKIKLIEHETSPESKKQIFNNNFLRKHFIHYLKECDNENEEVFFIKFGGTPDLIQEEEYYYENLNKNGFEFLLQIDENGYTDNLLGDSYPFHYGALYIYAEIKNNIINNPIAGFWQFS